MNASLDLFGNTRKRDMTQHEAAYEFVPEENPICSKLCYLGPMNQIGGTHKGLFLFLETELQALVDHPKTFWQSPVVAHLSNTNKRALRFALLGFDGTSVGKKICFCWFSQPKD